MELILQNDLGSRLNKDDKIMVTLNKLLKENDLYKRTIREKEMNITNLENKEKLNELQMEKYK